MNTLAPGEANIIVGEFSKTPYGRFTKDGKFNGEKFRKELLLAPFSDPEISKVNIFLDTVEDGYEYGSSFLEEAFGGLVRIHKLDKSEVLKKLNIITSHTDYILEIKDYISAA